MEEAANTASLEWWDFMIFKTVSKTHETRHSLDYYDIHYLLKLNEAINLEEYLMSLQRKDSDMKAELAKVK